MLSMECWYKINLWLDSFFILDTIFLMLLVNKTQSQFIVTADGYAGMNG